MALKNCPECGYEVSEKAYDCPKCGFSLQKPKRGFFGKLFKWSFIIFNAIMLLWIIGGYNAATDGMESMSVAERAGAAIGTGLGMSMLFGLWLVGDIILGLFVIFTRPKK